MESVRERAVDARVTPRKTHTNWKKGRGVTYLEEEEPTEGVARLLAERAVPLHPRHGLADGGEHLVGVRVGVGVGVRVAPGWGWG
eukprot:scaffold56043_cov36-Phaeocystis_antarctica.AAC.1